MPVDDRESACLEKVVVQKQVLTVQQYTCTVTVDGQYEEQEALKDGKEGMLLTATA